MVDVVLLNWNELTVSKDSVRRLLKEPEVDSVFVVDNGSTDGSAEYFDALEEKNPNLVSIPLIKNFGPSVARNQGISSTTCDIFLLDGDILYVPGTIAEYTKILDKYPDAFCVGQNSFELLMHLGHNGTQDPMEADVRMSDDYTLSDWFPMAWTQYGLFRGDLLREHPFIETPPFHEPFYGFEDDYLYHEMKEAGYVSLAVDKPLYYHEAHTGVKELVRTESKAYYINKFKECKKVFEKRWGKGNTWSETLARENPKHTTRSKP